MTAIDPPVLITKFEAMHVLRVSLRTLERMLTRGTLPSVKVGGRRLLLESDVEAYIAGARGAVCRACGAVNGEGS